jgi:hypothetical protein
MVLRQFVHPNIILLKLKSEIKEKYKRNKRASILFFYAYQTSVDFLPLNK